MKKFFMMAVMTVLTMTASAQVEKGMRYGITFTGTMSKYSELPDAGNTFGYGGGFILEYNFTPNVYLGSEVQFGLRGSKAKKLEFGGQPVIPDGSLKSYNLIIPVNIGGRVNLSDNVALFGQVGPYASFAIKKAELQLLDISTIKGESFDWGFNGKIGVEFSQIQLFGGYELGMKEVWIWPENSKNRSFVFGVGYTF
jgi:opacity protein-like surface antigen